VGEHRFMTSPDFDRSLYVFTLHDWEDFHHVLDSAPRRGKQANKRLRFLLPITRLSTADLELPLR
jgi:DNA-binding transcriptional regulator/RsmH inhibitor MraZ